MPKPTHRVILVSLLIVAAMFSFSFALSPLYSAFCKATGFYSGVKIDPRAPDLTRTITVQFVTINNQELPWDFYPDTATIDVHPNENTKVLFFAKNKTKHSMTVQAIPSFAPTAAGQHFHKTECFCFRQQTLKAGQAIEMPVVFQVDDNLPRTVHTITLAYTLFAVRTGK